MSRPERIDWEGLAAAWRQSDVPALLQRDLARRMARHTRLMWLVTATEALVLIGLATFSWTFIRSGSSALELVLIGALWILALVTEAFSLWNRRGSWRIAIQDAVAYLDLWERRARAKLRVARGVRILVFLQTAVVIAFVLSQRSAGSAPNILVAFVLGALLVIGYIAWSFWYERRARKELAELDAARTLLQNGS